MSNFQYELQCIINVLNAEMTRNEPNQLIIRLMSSRLKELADKLNN